MTHFLKYSASAAVLALVGFGAAAPAIAADAPMDYDTWYISVFGGYNIARTHASFSTDHYEVRVDDGFTVGAAIGSYVADGVRLEREISFAKNQNKEARFDDDSFEPQSGDMSAVFLMTNIWKDFRLTEQLQPYVGGGLGVALLSGEGDGYSDPYDFKMLPSLGLQVGAGVRYAVTDRLALDVGYRYRAAVDASHLTDDDSNNNGAFSFYNHAIQAGLTYAFRDNGRVMPVPEGDSGLYVSLFAGGAAPSTTSWEYEGTIYGLDHKNGFTVGAAVGTQLAPGLRGEVELSYLRSKLNQVSFRSNVNSAASGALEEGYLLLNVWKDFNLGPVSPYIGGGIGFATAHFDGAVADSNDLSDDTGVGIAGQFGFGARLHVSDALSVDLGYRYKSIIDAMIVGGNDWSYDYDIATHNHILQAGVTYGLGAAAAPSGGELTNKYVSLFGGITQAVDTHFNYDGSNYIANFKTGFTVGAAVGGNINEKLRGELELSFVNGDVSEFHQEGVNDGLGGEVDGYYLLANLWRDVDMGLPVTPYFGGGVGLALMDVDVDISNNDPNVDQTIAFAAQLGTGVRFDVSDNLTLDAGYRFKAAMGAYTEGTDNVYNTMASYYTHVGQIGLTWKF